MGPCFSHACGCSIVKKYHALPPTPQLASTNVSSYPSVEIEYITPPILDDADPYYSEMKLVFERFQANALAASTSFDTEDEGEGENENIGEVDSDEHGGNKKRERKGDSKDMHASENRADESDSSNEAHSGEENDMDASSAALSKKKARKLNRMSIAELKRRVRRPEVVEVSVPQCPTLHHVCHWGGENDIVVMKVVATCLLSLCL